MLVLGGTGLTGKQVCMYAVEQGYQVKILCRSKERLPAQVVDGAAEIVVVDDLLADPSVVQELAKGCDGIMMGKKRNHPTTTPIGCPCLLPFMNHHSNTNTTSRAANNGKSWFL